MQLPCQKMPTSKNNFWLVKPFKYKDLPCWYVDDGACQLSDARQKSDDCVKKPRGLTHY